MTKFLLDSGDPKEYKEIIKLAKAHRARIWGATTNPTLIAKTLTGNKFTYSQAMKLQKKIVMEILELVPGAVSAEVYADKSTTSKDMIEQGLEIASWNKRVYVKLPTILEAFTARTALREKNVPVNNTLMFTQQQIFAICLHEDILRRSNNIQNQWPSFISPFVGRLDDKGENGMDLIGNGMKIKDQFSKDSAIWMLVASTRKVEHVKKSIELKAEIITAPAKLLRDWFALSDEQKNNLNTGSYTTNLKNIPFWQPAEQLKKINTLPEFYKALKTNQLNINHPLTDTGLERFAADWQAILASDN